MENKVQKCSYDHSLDGTPICGLHREPLIEQSPLPDYQNPPGIGHVTVFVCAVTLETLRRARNLVTRTVTG
jgi:hypothetical protein